MNIWIILQYTVDSYDTSQAHVQHCFWKWVMGQTHPYNLDKKNPESRKFLKSWKSLSGGGGKAEFILNTSISITVHFLFSLQFFTRGRKKWGEGDSVFKHVNLRKSVCYDEKWVGVGGRPRPLMLRACILHVTVYLYICMRSHWTR